MTYPATSALANFTQDLNLDQLPKDAVANAKLLALDTFGVALAAASMDIGQLILEHAGGGRSEATLWGAPNHTSAKEAALANGTLCSALDFDPGFHLTTHTLPAAMAAGELMNASGKSVLEGFAAGYEAGARLIDAIDSARHQGGGVTARGWYHVGFVGPIASALAAGKVLGLSQIQLQQAIGLACAAAGGIRQNFGTMAKAYQAGNAASRGLEAADLARSGFAGDPTALEASLGLLTALQIPAEATERALSKLNRRWELLEDLKIKRFPACTPAHQPIQAALQLQREQHFTADDIERVQSPFYDRLSLIRLDPSDHVAAGFSLPFLMAAALVDRELTLIQTAKIHDPAIRQLMPKIHRSTDDSVTIRLRDGRTLQATAPTVDRLETEDEIDQKFDICTSHLPPAQTNALKEATAHMETLTSIQDVTKHLKQQ